MPPPTTGILPPPPGWVGVAIRAGLPSRGLPGGRASATVGVPIPRPYQDSDAACALVLLVEDHADTREMYAAVLADAGFEVVHAANGAEALAVTASALPAVVVTDLWMGGAVSAEDVCRRLHALGVPVLAVTVVAPGEEHEAMRGAGRSAVLLKPLAPDRLVIEVLRLLEGAN